MELIDKERNIWAKSITELSFEEVEFVLNWFGGGTIKELAFMYEKNINSLNLSQIVIFREHINFSIYSCFIPLYMKSSKEKRKKMKDNLVKKGIPKDNFDLLDDIIAEYQYKMFKKTLNKHKMIYLWCN